jgi:hypothetical protein
LSDLVNFGHSTIVLSQQLNTSFRIKNDITQRVLADPSKTSGLIISSFSSPEADEGRRLYLYFMDLKMKCRALYEQPACPILFVLIIKTFLTVVENILQRRYKLVFSEGCRW